MQRLRHFWQRQIWRRDTAGLLGALVLVLLLAAPILTYPLGRDQGMYANIGRSILQGGTPFIDMWDIKPPPIYYLYAGALRTFGFTQWAPRTLDLALIPLGMVGLYAVGACLQSRSLGLWAAFFYGIFYFREDFPSLSQNDSLVTVPMIFAALAAVLSAQSNRASRRAMLAALVTGLLCGLILWFKHYFAFFVLGLIFWQVVQRRALPWKEALAFCLGGLLSGGSLLLYFAGQGMLAEMWIIAQGTAAYNAQGYDAAAFVRNMGSYWVFRWQTWHLLLILVLLWLPTHWVRSGDPKWLHNRWAFVWLWLLTTLAFALIQAKGFDTHWIPMLPALALLAGGTVQRWVDLLGHRGWAVAFSAGLVMVVSFIGAQPTWGRSFEYIRGEVTRRDHFAQFQANDLKPVESLQVSEYLHARITPGDTLFVWGFRPEVTFMAGLRPATRYQAHFPLVAAWYPDDWRQQNVDILWAAMPPAVLVLEADYMPWVTDRDEDSHELLQEYTELNNWLIANYTRTDEIGDFIIWTRQFP